MQLKTLIQDTCTNSFIYYEKVAILSHVVHRSVRLSVCKFFCCGRTFWFKSNIIKSFTPKIYDQDSRKTKITSKIPWMMQICVCLWKNTLANKQKMTTFQFRCKTEILPIRRETTNNQSGINQSNFSIEPLG